MCVASDAMSSRASTYSSCEKGRIVRQFIVSMPCQPPKVSL